MSEKDWLSEFRAHPLRVPLVLATVGLGFSLVLEVLHIRAYVRPDAASFCSVNSTLDCTRVALSPYSVVLGLPVPMLGALGFFSILVAAWLRSAWLRWLAGAAVFASLAFLGIEIFWVGSVCLLCEAVHAVALGLGVAVWRAGSAWMLPRDPRDTLVYLFALPLGVVIAFYAFAPRYFELYNWKSEVLLPTGKTFEGHAWYGAAAPKLTVEEFTDYSCPVCRIHASRLLEQVVRHSRELRVVRRQFPRTRCVTANLCQPLRLAYCAEEQGRFWQADRWLFAHASGKGRVDEAEAARDIGLEPARLRSCLVRKSTLERAERESDEALMRGFQGTPTYVVSGKVVSAAELGAWISRL
ncbi:MAG: vitamin K epoxide reductase family protein [Polyangiaceae bacterium]|nr:vitamin K epoxide reductase family protein [Polyangiaceae bacterium]